MNVGFEDYNSADIATILGVQRCTVSYWCRKGYIRYQDVSSPGSNKPRYLFTIDEVDRVSKLIDKYGKNAWCNHADEGIIKANKPEKMAVNPVIEIATVNPVTDCANDDTEEIAGYIGKIKQLKRQRESLLAEIDSLDNAIRTMRQRVIDAI